IDGAVWRLRCRPLRPLLLHGGHCPVSRGSPVAHPLGAQGAAADDHRPGAGLAMSATRKPDRRTLLKGGFSLGALAMLTGCDVTDNEPVQRLLWNMSWWNDRVQGWLFNSSRLAPTYPESAVDRVFRYN